MDQANGRPRVSAREIRRTILVASKRAQRGHIGSALSVADLVAGIADSIDWRRQPAAERDRFVLSKGHAALAHYAALQQVGLLAADALLSYCEDGSRLAAHPDRATPGVTFSTGSLGLGVSFGVGSALAAQLRRSERRTIVLASDAELNCGLSWEALMFAAHRRLRRFLIVIDANGSQAFGATRDILDLTPIAERLGRFGFDAEEIDGHDAAAIRTALANPGSGARPRALVARTRLGHGVSFMQGRLEWHYLPLTDDQFQAALRDVETRD